MNVPFSVLDLASVTEGHTPADAFANSLDLAQHVESLGYTRYWFAEHHGMPSVASSATSLLIGHIAGGTRSIRVGSGGIMLPNHSPLIVAEQFGTLESLYPGRIDLGLGRAPGTDQVTAYAIRGENFHAQHNFAQDIKRLQLYFSSENAGANVRAIPGEGLDIPIWVLGSSTDSAVLAASMGLPYAFATHFAPQYFLPAIELYRRNFKPSATLREPYVMACINVVAADSDLEAERIATSVKMLFLGVITGKRGLMKPPVDSMDGVWAPHEEEAVMQMLKYSFIGGPDRVAAGVSSFVASTGVNELMVTTHVYDHAARLRSYAIFADILSA